MEDNEHYMEDWKKMLLKRRRTTTWGEYASEYIEVTKARRAYNTQQMYMYTMKKMSELDDLPILTISAIDLQKVVNRFWDSHRTCDNIKIVIDQVFRRAVREGLIEPYRNPALDVEYPDKADVCGSRRILSDTEEEFLPLVRRSEPEHARLLILILQGFGVRPQEAVPLTLEHFDMENMKLTIDRAVYWVNNHAVIKGTKNSKIRSIPIPQSIAGEIRERLSKMSKDDYFLQTEPGVMLTKSGINDIFRRVGTKIADMDFDRRCSECGMTAAGIRKKLKDKREAAKQLRRFTENNDMKIRCRAAGRFLTLTGTRIYDDKKAIVTDKKLKKMSASLEKEIDALEEMLPKPEKGFTPYCLRHTYATKVLYYCGIKTGRITMKFASYTMGHSELVFQNTYAHLWLSHEQDFDVINDGIGNI